MQDRKAFLLNEYCDTHQRQEEIFEAISKLTDGNFAIMILVKEYGDARIETEEALKETGEGTHEGALREYFKMQKKEGADHAEH